MPICRKAFRHRALVQRIPTTIGRIAEPARRLLRIHLQRKRRNNRTKSYYRADGSLHIGSGEIGRSVSMVRVGSRAVMGSRHNGSRAPKRSCLLIECDETHTSQRDLNFSKFDRASCLRCRDGVADLANFCGLSPPRWAQGSAFGRAWSSSLRAPGGMQSSNAYSVGSDVTLVGAKPLSGRGHARIQFDLRKYRGSSKSK
jgi:hypothetical protein